MWRSSLRGKIPRLTSGTKESSFASGRRGAVADDAIFAGKPTNKAEQSAAESVERRVEAKGNTGQQSTHRAQDRESVSQALDRIRQVARHRKKEKFTALFHHITVQLLREAFFELKENAAPGVDGLRWRG
jgi:RNA-directed DNA polymerase